MRYGQLFLAKQASLHNWSAAAACNDRSDNCKACFSLAHKHKHKHKHMWKQVKTGSTKGPIRGHFDPDLMQTYQKQFGGRFVRHIVYHGVEESWSRELSQICNSASMSLCLCASENQA